MMSKKLTLSLASLLVLIAFGLAYVVPPVMAHDVVNEDVLTRAEVLAGRTVKVWLSVDESVQDVSSDDGVQIASSRTREDREIDELDITQVAEGAGRIIVLATFDTDVHLQILDPVDLAALVAALASGDRLSATNPLLEVRPGVATDPATQRLIDFISSGGALGADDVRVDAFDNEGRNLGTRTLAEVLVARFIDGSTTAEESAVIIKHKNPAGRVPGEIPGREFLIQIDQTELENVYAPQGRGGGVDPEAGLEIHTLYFSIPGGVVAEASRDAIITARTGKHLHTNAISAVLGSDGANPLRVDMVDDDEGDPNYDQIRGTTVVEIEDLEATPDDGVPGVVYITAPNIVVRSEYYAHILLTEQPKDNTFPVIVDRGQGTAGDPEWLRSMAPEEFAGESFEVNGGADTNLRPRIPGGYSQGNGWSTATAGDTGTYDTGEYIDAVPAAYDADTRVIVGGSIPQATGRDNMYHLYRVKVTPSGGATGDITVSVGQFDDKVLPLPNTYLPLTVQQRRATTFVGNTEQARVTRIMNSREALTTPLLSVAADTTSDTALATAAYEARQLIFDANQNLKPLDAKFFIPANGYLLLVNGADEDASGVISVPDKTKDRKITTAQEKYRVKYDFKLPFPASDLENFFRNGGTLQLVYADITAATDSGHDDAKGPTGDDATDYTAASTDAHAADAVIINEIMWGLNSARGTDIQYIELHNTTDEAIGIDSKEWAIAVGSAPSDFTVIDMVGNLPDDGYWAVPGQSGQSVLVGGFPVRRDAVSMSRTADRADGTAEASWASSARRMTQADGTIVVNANLVGTSVGTPGAANAYVMPDPAATPPDTMPPAAAVAEAGDVMISEIMVASDGGRFPQWIELANVSASEVSLMGWMVAIANDPADAGVAGSSIGIELGDVTIGEDQAVLIVSKTSGRNSGVGTGTGDIRADRIVDVRAMVSPDNANYMLLSEMGFTITLMPPSEGAVKAYADMVGNLGKGWDLPMSEDDRSSIIRREMGKTAEIMGTDAAGWVLASDTNLDGAYTSTYYGHQDDIGTPGYNAGGALPVELSAFGAKRDPLTGAVVITWSTQSELNNAGFFIKRSQQQNSQFVVVNPTMVAGAGTTAEKQSYTYTDATADPNVIYYYQIEDVSLDGNRQTLTRAHRLKGHIGAAGKATTTWGDLKSSRD